MSRFINLEFDDEANHEFQPGGTAPVKDEAYYLAEARAAFENGKFEPGLRFYAKVLEFNARNAAAWTGQVRMLIELGEFREAKLWADKALERFPNEPELLAAKAVALAFNLAAQFPTCRVLRKPFRNDELLEAVELLAHRLYRKLVGFYLWLDRDLAWAQGTYEYRPMGTAVISVFRPVSPPRFFSAP